VEKAQPNETVVSLREYFERALADMQVRMDERSVAAEKAIAVAMTTSDKAIAAALESQNKQTSAAFAAAKEALAEAKIQLEAYKTASNEWRATLNDIISKMMMRAEVEAAFASIAATALAMQKTEEDKIEGLRKRIADLELVGQRGVGKEEASAAGHTQNKWNFQQVLVVMGIVLGALYFLAIYFKSKP
jgi:hypothetical protein